MNRKIIQSFCISLALLAGFAALTVILVHVDVQAIGPMGSSVGLASINGPIWEAVGVNMVCYEIAEHLGNFAVASALCCLLPALWQAIQRRSIWKADWDLYCLMGLYGLMVAAYVACELLAFNYRPVLLEGALEAAYPSSHTMTVFAAIPPVIHQLRRIRQPWLRKSAPWLYAAVLVGTVLCRFLSGVHWFTDIVGGALLGAGMSALYFSFCQLRPSENPQKGRID